MSARVLLYCVFAVSGMAGLVYETIWSRYLGLFVGHSAYAQILVLAIFLGGMSLGALLVGQRSERLSDPLLWYAAAELVAGGIGFIFHDIFLAVTDFSYSTLFRGLGAGPAVTIVKWLIAALLILPQSILLGSTFPLMSASVLRRVSHAPGRVLAMLYFSNSAGAAAGALITGFYFIKLAGLPGTMLIAGALNVIVAAIAYLVGRTWHGDAEASGEQLSMDTGTRAHGDVRPASALWRVLLLLSFGTAVASFIYEIAWIRMLSLVIGSATHSFELMLSAFILGLALGSLWVHRRADRFTDPVRALGITQWVMGFAALATLPLYAASFGWTSTLLATLQRSSEGYTAFNIARYAISLVIMLPATFCAGVTLPLITRTLISTGNGERSIGWVYGVNTLGSIIGAILGGLVLMPLIGLKALLVTGAAIDMLLGSALLARTHAGRSMRNRGYAAAAAAVVIVIGVVAGVRLDRNDLTAGVFRHGVIVPSANREILFYRDGRTATVSVVRNQPDSSISIATNGKPDGSLPARWFHPPPAANEMRAPLGGDAATQMLAPLYGLVHAPAARNVAVIGFGTGMSTHFMLGSPAIERVVTIEIEPAMIDGARSFLPANRRAYEDPRSEFVIDDAKSHFAVAGRRYDVIFSEPSNPWVSGVASLFTDEFYTQVKRYLTPDGVFAQWMHLYEIDDGLVLSMLSGLHRNFSSYEIFLANDADMVIVASNRSGPLTPDWRLFESPPPGSEFSRVLPISAENMEAARLTHRAALAPLLERWPAPNSDFYPTLDLGAERTRFMRTTATGFLGLATARHDFLAARYGRRRNFGTVTRAPFSSVPRMRSLALGAWLRLPESHVLAPLPAADPERRGAALQRRHMWEMIMARPPADWRAWLGEAVAVEADVHAGTSGVADETFYAALSRYANAHGAPPEVKQGIAFMHGLATWNFAESASASGLLVIQALAGRNWVPVDLLHDGAAWSHFMTGDVVRARAVHRMLASRLSRPPGDLRTELLEAYIDEAGQRTALHSTTD